MSCDLLPQCHKHLPLLLFYLNCQTNYVSLCSRCLCCHASGLLPGDSSSTQASTCSLLQGVSETFVSPDVIVFVFMKCGGGRRSGQTLNTIRSVVTTKWILFWVTSTTSLTLLTTLHTYTEFDEFGAHQNALLFSKRALAREKLNIWNVLIIFWLLGENVKC